MWKAELRPLNLNDKCPIWLQEGALLVWCAHRECHIYSLYCEEVWMWCGQFTAYQHLKTSWNIIMLTIKPHDTVNSSSSGHNSSHSADGTFKPIFIKENYCILIRISLKFVPKGPIDNKPVLVQVMAWRRSGDKPLPEPTLAQFTDTYMRHWGGWVNGHFCWNYRNSWGGWMHLSVHHMHACFVNLKFWMFIWWICQYGKFAEFYGKFPHSMSMRKENVPQNLTSAIVLSCGIAS